MLGGVIALYVSGQTLSISAIIGFISLLGVSVMNGILVQTYYRELIHSGRTVSEAIWEAHEHRMRPLLTDSIICCHWIVPSSCLQRYWYVKYKNL
jgi:cobalt-zinc-cadmium resistance protein CzcA